MNSFEERMALVNAAVDASRAETIENDRRHRFNRTAKLEDMLPGSNEELVKLVSLVSQLLKV
jgi:hypothetical protein